MRRFWVIIFCATVFVSSAVYGIEQRRIKNMKTQTAVDLLKSDWIAATFVIQLEKGGADFIYNPQQPAQAEFVKRIRHIFAIADENGRVMEQSNGYFWSGLPARVPPGDTPHIWESKGKADTPLTSGRYLLCTGPIRFSDGRRYQLTLGRLVE